MPARIILPWQMHLPPRRGAIDLGLWSSPYAKLAVFRKPFSPLTEYTEYEEIDDDEVTVDEGCGD
jgi:hypothetical protein